MVNTLAGKIKVPKKIKPLRKHKRIVPELKVGRSYFICFHNNNVYPCILKEIIQEFEETEVRVVIPLKPQYIGKGYSDDPYAESVVYANEIGLTVEEAVKNTVKGLLT